MKNLLLLLCITVFLQTIVFAQDSDSRATQTENSDTTGISFWKEHNFNFAAIPIVAYDPSLGWNFAGMLNAFFQVSAADTVSPLSLIGGFGGYTTNKSWYWGLYTKLYFDEDNYRLSLAYGDISINFQYFEEQASTYIGFNTLYDAFMFEGRRRIYNRWYLGLKYVGLETKTLHEIEGEDPITTNMNNMGFIISHDTRDLIYNPMHGDYMDFKTGHYRETLGSDYIFDKWEFTFTDYFNIDTSRVVAARFAAFIATGDVPFEGQYIVGNDDIRGYTDGKHRGDQVYALQAAYRWHIVGKWGIVAFAGIATAVDAVSEISFNELLPGVGVGLRYMMIPSEKINVGIDVAFGKEDWGVYFRITEAFGS